MDSNKDTEENQGKTQRGKPSRERQQARENKRAQLQTAYA